MLTGHSSGGIRYTNSTTNVNQPDDDRRQAETARFQRQGLDGIAKAAGYTNWHRLGQAALNGERILINGEADKG